MCEFVSMRSMHFQGLFKTHICFEHSNGWKRNNLVSTQNLYNAHYHLVSEMSINSILKP